MMMLLANTLTLMLKNFNFIAGNRTMQGHQFSPWNSGSRCCRRDYEQWGYRKLAGGCEIMPVRIGVIITDIRVALGLNWASGHGAKFVNLSLRCVATEALVDAIQNTWNSGLVICAATGNNAVTPLLRQYAFPLNTQM